MELLITYDVETTTPEGARRLRRVAKICEGYGHRVQQSVFEITCNPTDRLKIEAALAKTIAPALDSIRIYQLDKGTFDTARHLGAAITPPHNTPLVL